ncbi:MAG: segregation/condensation protein A [Actinobacteria bacterium]|nr:segregation/condensation protein A [Actinomycetota bacterium]
MTYQVKLEVFEGPFDLLLHLISRRKVEVTEVDLAEITGDFLASLTGIDVLDLETATRFLVVAATLIELKAARLLPREEVDELEDILGEARDLLYARLLEYRAFRDAAALLKARFEANEGYVGREVVLDPELQRLVPETPLTIDVEGLAHLAALATAPRPEPRVDLSHIRKSYISIRDAARLVLAAVPSEGARKTFRALVGEHGRGDRVVFFLALLELYKLGHLDLAQEHFRAEIEIERRPGGRDLESLTDDEYEPDLPTDADPELASVAGQETT